VIDQGAMSWTHWQGEVLELLREDLRELLDQIALDDVDWPLWQHFYLQGRTPRAAINLALELAA
jgi:hypothetical protein